MTPLTFSPIALADLPRVRSIVERTPYQSCQLSAGGLYALAEQYDTHVCFADGFLFVRQQRRGVGTCYFMPVGVGRLSEALDRLREHAAAAASPLALWGIAEDMVDDFRAAAPRYAAVELTPHRDWAEYIHAAQRLLTLQGKHLQPKRNALNQLLRSHADFRYEAISEANVAEVLAFQLRQVEEQKERTPREALEVEHRAIRRALKDFTAAGFVGGLIRIDGGVAAFAAGCPISASTFDILFEKGDRRYNGVFQLVERELIRAELQGVAYINREEDLGIASLRFAKQALHPDRLLMKYTATLPNP
ncbi:MAG: phosphatidylglycerol lysyltransferase domain-containing protein [Prevotellaceae bacterium]|jgi:hypothetical protein|nr:phosphatidylglycerol lysyltransferase domain-containing protein [Prevotellaceae bacterium]